MAERSPVIVHSPSPSGGRRVTIRGQIVGLAYSVADVIEFLRRAGLEDVDESTVESSLLVEWRGGGPDEW